MIRKMVVMLLVLAAAAIAEQARADVRGKAIREAAEYILQKFGKEAAAEGAESLARRLAVQTGRHGDDVLVAARKVGPGALRLAEEAGEHAGSVFKVLAKHGDDGVWVVAQPRRLALVAQHGDDGARALLRHQGLAEPVIEKFGDPAVRALNAVGPKNGRRLATMLESGELQKLSQPQRLLEVIGHYGDRAAEFIWKHKGALTVAAVLTAFLAEPEPFLDGVKNITTIAAEKAVQPLAEVPGKVAEHAARQTNWTVVALVGMVLGTLVSLVVVLRWTAARRRTELLSAAAPDR